MQVPLLTPFKLFEPHECDAIIDRAKHSLAQGRTTGGVDTNIRSNSVAWLEFEDQGRFYDCMTARDDHTVTWLQHPYQVSCYRPGEFYDWHIDLIQSTWRSSVRSLTLTCTLEPAPGATLEFESGELDLDKGYAVLFDATTQHRANPPTESTRWSFTVWGMQPNPEKREAPAPEKPQRG